MVSPRFKLFKRSLDRIPRLARMHSSIVEKREVSKTLPKVSLSSLGIYHRGDLVDDRHHHRHRVVLFTPLHDSLNPREALEQKVNDCKPVAQPFTDKRLPFHRRQLVCTGLHVVPREVINELHENHAFTPLPQPSTRLRQALSRIGTFPVGHHSPSFTSCSPFPWTLYLHPFVPCTRTTCTLGGGSVKFRPNALSRSSTSIPLSSRVRRSPMTLYFQILKPSGVLR